MNSLVRRGENDSSHSQDIFRWNPSSVWSGGIEFEGIDPDGDRSDHTIVQLLVVLG